MRSLSSPLRKQLESAVLAARRASESASRAAIEGLGVFADRRPDHLDADQAALRNSLRAKWRQLDGDHELLVAECAYEQWHRLLFARFLAENDLLLHPRYRAPVTLADCEELATELGEPDGWSVGARFAAEILPGIFRLNDPCVRLRLAPEGRHALEQALDRLPTGIFAADDALGWVYQFWQKDKKDEVNASERKIAGADLGPVTQLFTENYMVRFLLENSLGAWWTARHPDSPLVKGFDYLRFNDDGSPAAGSFDGWPARVAEVTVMDPCCGSGHFLVEAFSLLWQMRAEEEGLRSVDAQDAVLRDNLFGLELDPRCVQIAMFAVAMQAWKAGGGWRALPVPNIACSGIPVKAPVEEWKKLAGGNERLENALVRLHILFHDANTLGSLIDPRRATEVTNATGLQTSIEDVDWDEIAPLIAAASSREGSDLTLSILGANADATVHAAQLLARRYVLTATNVPFLSRGKQGQLLRNYLSAFHQTATGDLATAMFERMLRGAVPGGTVTLVTPDKLLYLGVYEPLRRKSLSTTTWRSCALLGARGFSTPMFDLGIILLTVDRTAPTPEAAIVSIDVGAAQGPVEKAARLQKLLLRRISQRLQLKNPNARVVLDGHLSVGQPLFAYADSFAGLQTGDDPRYQRQFWELPTLDEQWIFQLGSIAETSEYRGRTKVLRWERGLGALSREPGAVLRGVNVWGKTGVAIRVTGDLPATLYDGTAWDQNLACLIPRAVENRPALWAFVRSEDFLRQVRLIDQALKVTPGTMVKIAFDIDRWRQVAAEEGPIPEPWSDDPTQWLFKGRPEESTAPLQVAVGRLVGYRWPKQAESGNLDAFVDTDGIVCLPSVASEAPAAVRVQQVLAMAFGDTWSPSKVKELLELAGSKKRRLADWLCDEFFKQHCALFGNRPFIWHIWDGQRDGFAALVNYHRLDRKMLEKLTYTYLGQDWVERQRAEMRDEVAGAEARLSAALGLQRKLEAILDGEKPYDIYVRWKELHEQPVGWKPDLNDGVRLNIRPFVESGVLRAPFNIHWRKDRGKNPDGTERPNDVQLSLAEKLDARKRAGRT